MTDTQPNIDGIPVVNGPTRETLDERQLIDYEDYKRRLLTWLLNIGKNPETAEGYACSTVRGVSQWIDTFYRWVWDEEEGYTTHVTPDLADAFLRSLIYSEKEYANATKETARKCLLRLFKWRNYEHGEDHEWDPEYSFGQSISHPRDYLTVDERKRIREAALEYGSVPNYNAVTPDERDKWKTHLAQRFEKPKSEVTRQDWKRANGWKIPSLVWTSLDTGLRPIEVERATINWVDIDNHVLRIPKDESSKNHENWIIGITEQTGVALARWLDERELYDSYAETDALWLTREGNPYTSHSLGYVLRRLCDITEIEIEHRQMSWYSIRHSVGTYMTREEDLAAAQAQLRHKNPETTMRYDQTPVEDRRDALDKMG